MTKPATHGRIDAPTALYRPPTDAALAQWRARYMPDAPTCVIREPEKVLGDQAQTVLAFWRHLDRMTGSDWIAAWAAAWDAAWAAAWDAAGAAAGAAASASSEIQGAAVMRANGQPFFFLPIFGFADPEAVLAADKEQAK